jgi:hypothetical protein
VSIKVIEIGSMDELLDALHVVEQDMSGSKEQAHADPEHDPGECPWCQLEDVSEQLDVKTQQYNHSLAVLWALLTKLGPITLTKDELTSPHAIIGIDAQMGHKGLTLTAQTNKLQ